MMCIPPKTCIWFHHALSTGGRDGKRRLAKGKVRSWRGGDGGGWGSLGEFGD